MAALPVSHAARLGVVLIPVRRPSSASRLLSSGGDLSDGDDAGGCGVSGDGRGSELIRGGRRNGHSLSGSRDGDGHGANITAGSVTVARYMFSHER